MSEDKGVLGELKKVEASDIRLLVVGLLMLLIPVGFLWYSVRKPVEPTYRRIEDRSSATRGQPLSFKTSQVRTDSAGTQAHPRQVSLQEAIRAPDIETRRETDLRRVAHASYSPKPTGRPNTAAYMLFEADLHSGLQNVEKMLEDYQYSQAIAESKRILNNETNPLIRALASSFLCAAYEATGDEEKLAEEIHRLAGLIEELPENMGFRAHLSSGLEQVGLTHGFIERIPEFFAGRAAVKTTIKEAGLEGHIAPEELLENAAESMEKFKRP